MDQVITLSQFIIENQKDFPYAKGELSRLLNDIGLAAKLVNRTVNKAGLAQIFGKIGAVNIQGEEQQKLDVFADKQFLHALESGRECCMVASEEQDQAIIFPSNPQAKYIVCIDPLDGSANIDVNVSVGTIFSIYRRQSTQGLPQLSDVLQPGNQQVAAGYIIYGSSTMLVYTTGKGVHGFTLDPSLGEFCLSHPNIRIPEQGHIYSVNQGNYKHFPEPVKAYVNYCQEIDAHSARPYTARYIGSMVADIHRNLLLGGIFLYPASLRYPQGKLRLLYECNPLAWIVEQAGGCATDGRQRILSIVPTSLHMRSPIYIGSKGMLQDFEAIAGLAAQP